MNETQIREAMHRTVAAIAAAPAMPAETLRRARRGRRRTVAASLAAVALVTSGVVYAIRIEPAPSRQPVVAAPACSGDVRTVGTIGRDASMLDLSAASADAAFFTGVSPAYYTYTANDRPRAGRIDANGHIEWIAFDHPEDGFQTRTAASPAAVSADEAWFLVDAGGRYVGESALWHVDGDRVTRPALVEGRPVRSVGVSAVVARDGRAWTLGGSRDGLFTARYDGETWTRLPGEITDYQGVTKLTPDRGGTLYALVDVTDQARMPKPGPGGEVPAILIIKQAIWRHDGSRWIEVPMPSARVSTIQGGRDGELWAAVYDPGLRVMRFAGGAWSTVAKADARTASSVRLATDDEGRLFVADYLPGESRLWVFAGSTLTRQPLPEPAATTQITGLAVTNDGAEWLLAGTTVYRGLCR